MKRLESLAVLCAVAAMTPLFGQALKVEAIANPSSATSLQAHWGMAQDGSPLLSWVETTKDGSHTLRYAIRRGAQWSEARTIVANRHFFRQPAESPSVSIQRGLPPDHIEAGKAARSFDSKQVAGVRRCAESR